MTCICTSTNPEPILWTTSYLWLLHSRRQFSFALIIPGLSMRHCLLKLFKPDNHRADYLPCLAFPTEATIKVLAHAFPSLLPSDQPRCFSRSWELWVSTYFLNGNCLPDLLPSPYPNNNKTHIYKQDGTGIAGRMFSTEEAEHAQFLWMRNHVPLILADHLSNLVHLPSSPGHPPAQYSILFAFATHHPP